MCAIAFEKATISRLEETITRLDDIVSDRIIELYSSEEFLKLKPKKLLKYVYENRSIVNNLARIKTAQDWINHANQSVGWAALNAYVNSAYSISLALSELSTEDEHKAQCKVSVTAPLKAALKKAKKNPIYEYEAEKVYNFVLNPTLGWCSLDLIHHIGRKSFGLVESENKFNKLLESGYEEITSQDLCGIRIAYKYTTDYYTDEERDCILKTISIGLNVKDDTLRRAVNFLYPEILYHGMYKIYVPKN